MKHYLRNIWNGIAIVLFAGFMVSMVMGVTHNESTAIMKQADLAALTQ